MYVCLAFFFSDLTSCTISIIVYGVFKDRDAITVDVVVVLMKGYNFPVLSKCRGRKKGDGGGGDEVQYMFSFYVS